MADDIDDASAVLLAHFTVVGTPRPKGSLRPFTTPAGKPRVREQLPGAPDWRRAVTEAAHEAISDPATEEWGSLGRVLRHGYPAEGPVCVDIELRFPPPKSKHDPLPCTRTTGDGDKHARQIFDALQDARVIRDDAQVVDHRVSKRYADPTQTAGANVTVWRASAPASSSAEAVDEIPSADAAGDVPQPTLPTSTMEDA